MVSLSFSANSVAVFSPNTSKPTQKSLSALLSERSSLARFQGIFSKKSQSNLKRTLGAWDYFNKEQNKNPNIKKFTSGQPWRFITLTLPSEQIHTNKQIKRDCLNHFLVTLQRTYKGISYLWKAELQRNKNIHFHILIDSFCPHEWIRNTWNEIVNKLGYVDRYSAKCKKNYNNDFTKYLSYFPNKRMADASKAFHKGVSCNWTDPNSTDIHQLKHKRNPVAYIAKYVSKENLNGQIFENTKGVESYNFGRVWGCSDNLRNLPELKVELEFDEYLAVYKFYKERIFSEIQNDNFTLLIFPLKAFDDFRSTVLQNFSNINFST